jgi:hypothetical protein
MTPLFERLESRTLLSVTVTGGSPHIGSLSSDSTAPQVSFRMSRQRGLGRGIFQFAVTYADPDDAVALSSITASNVSVRRHDGAVEVPTLLSVAKGRSDRAAVATYQIDLANRPGDYTVVLGRRQVHDSNANFAAGGEIGAFSVVNGRRGRFDTPAISRAGSDGLFSSRRTIAEALGDGNG